MISPHLQDVQMARLVPSSVTTWWCGATETSIQPVATILLLLWKKRLSLLTTSYKQCLNDSESCELFSDKIGLQSLIFRNVVFMISILYNHCHYYWDVALLSSLYMCIAASFWQSPKRPPSPLVFEASNIM